MKNCYLSDEQEYSWILKPTYLNRGRGIHLFNNLDTLVKLINE